MPFSHLHYLPLPAPFFAAFGGLLLVLAVLLQIGALRYVCMRLGIGSGAALMVLAGSLIGSYFNIPVAEFPERNIVSGQEIAFYGMQYVVPVVVQWPGTIVAVNVGGALIPTLMSLYLLARERLWGRGLIAIVLVAGVCNLLAHPVRGLGIALPVFVPALSTAVVALMLSPRYAAPLAYIGGSLGTLIGADLLNMGHVQGLGAPIASIGGAGTFDGIFLTGILAVLIASVTGWIGERGNLAETAVPLPHPHDAEPPR